MLRGQDLALKEINAKGGIKGRPVKVIKLDDGYDTKRCAENVVKLIEIGAKDIAGDKVCVTRRDKLEAGKRFEDRATFDEVIQRLPDGDVHVIACGSPQSGGNLDTERLNLMLDTLDEVYDHIVVTGTDEAARVLFLGVEGRFDACIIVGDARPDGLRGPPETETFLGYHVTDIDLLRIEAIHPERHGVARLARSQDAALERV